MSDSATPGGRRWMLVGWLTIFLVGTDLFVVSPFLPVIGRDLQADPAHLTWMVSVFSAIYAIACPLQGRLAERLGAPTVLLGGVVTLAVANLLTALAPGLPSLLASRALAGLGAASTSPMLYALAADLAGPHRRGADLARINSGLVIALVMGAPIGLLMGDFSDWRVVFAALAMAFAVMLPVNRQVWRSAGASVGVQPNSARGVLTAEPLSAALPYLAAMMCWSASVYAIYTLLGTALTTDYQLGTPGIAGCLAAFGLGATIGSVSGGRLADHFGPARMTTLCFVAMAGTEVAIMLVYPTLQPVALAAMLFAFALSAYGFFPALQACAAQRFTARRPTVLGLVSSSLYIGITLGAAIGGRFFHLIGMTGVIALALVPSLAGMLITRRFGTQGAAPAMTTP